MILKRYTRTIFALALACAGLFGQTVSSSLVGTVVNPSGAAVADAPVTLASVETGAGRLVSTDKTGVYRFPDLTAGTYTVTIKQPGFKTSIETDIVVRAQENTDAGKITLQAGSVTEFNTLTASGGRLQLAETAQSYTIDAGQIETLTLKGRDMFGYLKLIPGVVDTNPDRDLTSPSSIQGITIAGNVSAFNFNVDGITDMDTGAYQRVDVEPNVDAISEIRVLASNYEAEYGRNSGGVVSVITRSGSQDFHGTASWDHRNEEFNANSWANNHTLTAGGTATPRDPYRFNVETFGIGGPLYIPKVANVDKKKAFFFFSQERTGQYVPAPSQTTYMPTNSERDGDFSQTFTNVNGNAGTISILDPQNNNTQFAGNIIPLSRISPIGGQLLSYFPGAQLYADAIEPALRG